MDNVIGKLRIRFLLVVLCLFAGGLCFGSEAGVVRVPLAQHLGPGERHMGIRLLGTLLLPPLVVNGQTLGGLSGLAWDDDEEILYAISDDSSVFHLEPVIEGGVLTDLAVRNAYPLRDTNSRRLKRPWADAEGLTLEKGANGVSGDTQLLISFEGRPRIARHAVTGEALAREALPAPLRSLQDYASGNKGLESLTLHHRWGLLTGPEQPLRSASPGIISIYSLDGRSWSYPLYPAPRSALVAMEALPDGSLLTLERAFVSVVNPLIITLRRAVLTSTGTGPLAVENVAVLDNTQGWLIDNFEGLTRHRGQRFFMVSDDNRRVLQSTLLVYFELLSL